MTSRDTELKEGFKSKWKREKRKTTFGSENLQNMKKISRENSLNSNWNDKRNCRIERNSIENWNPSENGRKKSDIWKRKFVKMTKNFRRENSVNWNWNDKWRCRIQRSIQWNSKSKWKWEKEKERQLEEKIHKMYQKFDKGKFSEFQLKWQEELQNLRTNSMKFEIEVKMGGRKRENILNLKEISQFERKKFNQFEVKWEEEMENWTVNSMKFQIVGEKKATIGRGNSVNWNWNDKRSCRI